jgi:hypothetical protein
MIAMVPLSTSSRRSLRRDHAIPDRPVAIPDSHSVCGEFATGQQPFPRGRIQPIAGGVVACDQRHAGHAVLGAQSGPLVGHGVERVVLGGVDGDGLSPVVEVAVGVAVVERSQRSSLGRVALADDLAQLGSRVGAGECGEPAACLDA